MKVSKWQQFAEIANCIVFGIALLAAKDDIKVITNGMGWLIVDTCIQRIFAK
jgi:hypothetical protein